MLTWTNALIFLMMLVGTVGIVIPVLPGLLLVWGGSLVWALVEQSTTGWVVLAITTVTYAAAFVLQILFPGRRMKAAGLSNWALALALVVAVIGIFVIPVLGGPIGFVAAVFVIELLRRREPHLAWTATVEALKAVAVNMGIELTAAAVIILTWGVAVFASR